jgi:TetR/AcrR family transcriptional regulator
MSVAEGSGARSIIDAATELFAEEGFEPVSVARIAARAGVCKANVFHHFESKEHLVLAVMQQASSEHAERAEALLAMPGTSADKLRQLIGIELELMLSHGARTKLLMRECQDHGHPRARLLAQQVFKRNFDAITALFEQGRASGEFRADLEPAAATLLTLATTNFFMQHRETLSRWPQTLALFDPKVWIEHICAIVLDGIITERQVQPAAAPRRPARKTTKAKS